MSMVYSMQVFGVVWWLLTLGAFYEAYSMDNRQGAAFAYIVSVSLFMSSCAVGILYRDTSYFIGAIILIPLSFMIIQMLAYKSGQGRQDFAQKTVGLTLVTYVCVGYGSVFILTMQDWPTYILIFLFSINWLQDTCAYIGGRLFGRIPFSPYLSPKKTWEGAIIGMIGACGVWAFLKFNFHQLVAPILLDYFWVLFFAVAIAGQLGDLLESFFKRSLGVKDSGKLIPGHGGVLDRFDSVILGAVVLSVFTVLRY